MIFICREGKREVGDRKGENSKEKERRLIKDRGERRGRQNRDEEGKWERESCNNTFCCNYFDESFRLYSISPLIL